MTDAKERLTELLAATSPNSSASMAEIIGIENEFDGRFDLATREKTVSSLDKIADHLEGSAV